MLVSINVLSVLQKDIFWSLFLVSRSLLCSLGVLKEKTDAERQMLLQTLLQSKNLNSILGE